MRLSEYLEVGKKMKTARTNAGISQRDMAIKLALSNSSYSRKRIQRTSGRNYC